MNTEMMFTVTHDGCTRVGLVSIHRETDEVDFTVMCQIGDRIYTDECASYVASMESAGKMIWFALNKTLPQLTGRSPK